MKPYILPASAVTFLIGGALLFFTGGVQKPDPQPDKTERVDAVILSKDSPDVATIKANILYLREQASEFRELADRAGEFKDSGSAATWMEKRSASGHLEAFRGWHGWLFQFFGEGKEYKPEDVKRWAKGVADGADRAAETLGRLLK